MSISFNPGTSLLASWCQKSWGPLIYTPNSALDKEAHLKDSKIQRGAQIGRGSRAMGQKWEELGGWAGGNEPWCISQRMSEALMMVTQAVRALSQDSNIPECSRWTKEELHPLWVFMEISPHLSTSVHAMFSRKQIFPQQRDPWRSPPLDNAVAPCIPWVSQLHRYCPPFCESSVFYWIEFDLLKCYQHLCKLPFWSLLT